MTKRFEDNPRIVWLTNLPAPYRIPIWNKLAQSFDLNVVFSLKEDNYRGWSQPKNQNYSYKFLNKFSLHWNSLELVLGIQGVKGVLEPADILIAGGWESPIVIRALLITRKMSIPSVLFYESTLNSRRFNGFLARKFRSWVFSLADYVVTVGKASTEAALDIGVPSEKIVTLFNPVDVQWFSNFANRNRVEVSRGHRFIYVGQLIERKNVAALIDAFSNIRQPDDLLTIVGDGPLSLGLAAQVKLLGLEKVIRFTGHCDQEQVALEYSRSDTFILPSTEEVWGLVANEALASGLHAVISIKAGVAEFVQPMPGVFIAEPTTNEIAKALELSRAKWVGPISKPEILSYTPERFAAELTGLLKDIEKIADRPSLTWVTNIPIPYRVPIWNALNSKLDFSLITITDNELGRKWELSKSMKELDFRSLNSKTYYFGTSTALYFQWRRTWSAIKKYDSKIIYFDGYESPAFFVPAYLAKRRKIKVLIGYRSTLNSRRFNGFLARKFRSWVFSLADYVVTVGKASTEAALDIGVPSEKIVTLFNPVDVQWFSNFANRNRVEVSRGHRFIYVGQLIERKNVAALIDAFSNIRQPDDLLTIVGDGPLSLGLAAQVKLLGLEKVIRFTGHCDQEQVALEYSRSDTFILPSTEEVWGLVANEALASGLHAVISIKAGVAEFVQPMPGVFIAEPTTNEIAKALELSRAKWVGPISKPEILSYTPERFAGQLIEISLPGKD